MLLKRHNSSNLLLLLTAVPHLFDFFRRLTHDAVFSETHSSLNLRSLICRRALTPMSAVAINHAENVRRHRFHRTIRIDRHQLPLIPVLKTSGADSGSVARR